MKTKIFAIVLIAALALAESACTIPVSLTGSQPDQNQVALSVAQTVAAVNALKAQQQAAQATQPPAPTIAPPATAAHRDPCTHRHSNTVPVGNCRGRQLSG